MNERAPRIFVLFHGRMPSEKAAGLWAAKTAEALGFVGASVTLLASNRGGRDDVFAAYGLERNFEMVRVPIIDLFGTRAARPFAFAASAISFSFSALAYLRRNARKDAVIFSNEPLAMLLASLFFRNCFYELHVLPARRRLFFRVLFRRMRGIVAINDWLGREVSRIFGVSAERVCVARSGVSTAEFDTSISKEEARVRVGVPTDAQMALYTGHLYPWKGVDTLADAAALVPNVLIVFVGGTETDVAAFRKKYGSLGNIRIIGHRPHGEMPLWQKAADVLVVPNTAKEEISAHYTSPMKLFEYMTSGRPIVASRLPSIEEIISDETALLVEPDNPEALADGIRQALADTAQSDRRTRAARKEVEGYTWEKRAEHIKDFMVCSAATL